jgi:WD40 repeat protein
MKYLVFCRNNTEGSKGALSNIAVSYTASGVGPIVVTAGADNNLKVLDPRKSFQVLHTLLSHRDFIYSLYVSGN